MTVLRYLGVAVLVVVSLVYLGAVLVAVPFWAVVVAGAAWGGLLTLAVRRRRGGPAGLYRESADA